MKTALFGGSFDPVHEGHLSLAREVRDKTPYSRILFIPAASPPHKTLSGGAGPFDRLAMLRKVISAMDWGSWCGVWDGELKRPGLSYSIDTVRQLRKEGIVQGRPGLIIGDDLVEGFGQWKEAEQLAREAEIILARRLPVPPPEFPFPALRLNNPLWPFSSTDLRERMARGERLEGLIPAAAAEYIAERGLYG